MITNPFSRIGQFGALSDDLAGKDTARATTRRGYAWQGDYQLVPEPLLVAIDMGEITIR
jgi:hypothetical protein